MTQVLHQKSLPVQKTDALEVFDYDTPTWSLGLAMAEFNGRHPKKGRSCNTGCELAYYVISGSGTIHSENGTFEIGPGDVYIFKKGEKYFVEGRKLKVLMPSSPAWQSKDYKTCSGACEGATT